METEKIITVTGRGNIHVVPDVTRVELTAKNTDFHIFLLENLDNSLFFCIFVRFFAYHAHQR